MNEKWSEHPVPDEDVLRMNTVRSELILWIVDRFQTLLAEERHDAVSYTHLTLPTKA